MTIDCDLNASAVSEISGLREHVKGEEIDVLLLNVRPGNRERDARYVLRFGRQRSSREMQQRAARYRTTAGDSCW